MSGGSYNHLHSQIDIEGQLNLSDLEGMAERLHELAPGSAAAVETRLIVDQLREAGGFGAALAEVWRSVEWLDSGDYEEGQVGKEIAAYEATR